MGKEKTESKKETAKKALKALDELEDTVRLENIVKDNKIEFKIKDKQYRLRLPTAIEQEELGTVRRKEYTRLVSDDSFLFRKQWVEKYKTKGIDIEKMGKDIIELQAQIKDLLLRLAQTTDTKSIGTLKDEILKLREKQKKIAMERTDLLGYSIEDQLNIFTTSYTCYLVLEQKKKDKWVQYFSNFKDFEKSEDIMLMNQALYYINFLLYR